MKDNFRGDTVGLIASIEALLSLDAAGALVPHGVGGHARTLLESAAVRLTPRRGGEVAADVIQLVRWAYKDAASMVEQEDPRTSDWMWDDRNDLANAIFRRGEETIQGLATPAASVPAGGEVPDPSKVICPACAHQFRAIPEDVQRLHARDVEVSADGVRFGLNCWVSHEKITGYTAEQLNDGSPGLVWRAYMDWVQANLATQPPKQEGAPAVAGESVRDAFWTSLHRFLKAKIVEHLAGRYTEKMTPAQDAEVQNSYDDLSRAVDSLSAATPAVVQPTPEAQGMDAKDARPGENSFHLGSGASGNVQAPGPTDAERYQWLREHSDSMSLNPPLTVAKVTGWGLEGWSGDDLNSAIDAAILSSKAAGGGV